MTISIRAVRITDRIEADRIEAYLAQRTDSTPFHRPCWMAAIERACGHQAHYLLAVEDGSAIRGLLPMHDVRSALFGRALVSSGFAVGGGILADTVETRDKLAEAGWALAQKLKSPSLELRGGLLPEDISWHIDCETYAGFVRPLAGDEEAILLAIPRKQRAEVRRSLGLETQVGIGCGAADLEAHYRVYSESVRNLGTPVFPRRLFRSVLEAFGSDADILTVRHQGEPVASVLSLYHQGTVMPYWGGGTKEARGLRANDLMYFALMRHARARGCDRFDFGRSKAGTGAFAFKKNWGFEPEPLPYAIRTADGAVPRSINPLDPKYRLKIAAWQRLPLFAANRIGPFIARGLG
jgi:FemAB-related protein (PEP-CTERM system-associated)